MKICPNCKNSTINAMKKCPICKTELDDSYITSFGNALKKQLNNGIEAKAEEKERLSQLDRESIPYCPKCHSTSLSANKKGFGIGKAVIGAAVTAPIGGVGGLIGLTAGNIRAKKVRVTCLKCGYQFMAGKK